MTSWLLFDESHVIRRDITGEGGIRHAAMGAGREPGRARGNLRVETRLSRGAETKMERVDGRSVSLGGEDDECQEAAKDDPCILFPNGLVSHTTA